MNAKRTLLSLLILLLPASLPAQEADDSDDRSNERPAKRWMSQVPDGDRPMRGPNAQGRNALGPGRRGPNTLGQNPSGRAGAMQQMDPEKLAERLLSQFDEDGDTRLNATELATLLTELRGRLRGMGAAQMVGPRAGADAADVDSQMSAPRRRAYGGNSKAGKSRPGATNDDAQVGGDDPIRPGSKS